MEKRTLRSLSALTIVASAIISVQTASGAAVWTGGGADNNWSTEGNWLDTWDPADWGGPQDVELQNSTTGQSVVNGAYVVNKLTFTNVLPASFTLGGSQILTIQNGIATQFGGHDPYQVSANIHLTGGTILTGYNEGLQFSGNISGSAITFQSSGLATSEIMAGGLVGTAGGGSDILLDGALAWWAGVVTLQLNDNALLDDTADLLIVDGTDGKNGLLNLNFAAGTSEIVASLTINGTPMAEGTYGATGSGADFIDDAHFSGTGMLQVVPEPSLLGGVAAGLALLMRRNRRA